MSYTEEDKVVNIHAEEYDYSQDYLTFVAKSSGSFCFNGSSSGSTSNTISYSTDDGETWSAPSNTVIVNVNNGDKVIWKGEMIPFSSGNNYYGIGRFTGTATFDAQGNTMSLLFGDNFENQTSLNDKNYAFYGLFYNSNVINTQSLILPATTLANYCYSYMFFNCTNLTQAPQLPATTLTSSCYSKMFSGCTSLIAPPSELPAPIATYFCYSEMFSNCTSLVTSPKILATSMYVGSCYSMFYGCTSLTTAPELPATTLNGSISNNGCYESMFRSCTSLTTAPDLPAKTLAFYCYKRMFSECPNLNYIKMLATDISASYCLSDWTYHVASSGTFVKDASMTTLQSGANGIPEGWTVEDAT